MADRRYRDRGHCSGSWSPQARRDSNRYGGTGSVYSQIGLITLVGLIAKNGILIVAFANELQLAGHLKAVAIREAAMTRLRPILMTTAATVFGHLPLVFVTGAGAEARNSIGIMLVSGMAIGTLFTLFILPAVYMVVASQHRGDPVVDADGLAPPVPVGSAI